MNKLAKIGYFARSAAGYFNGTSNYCPNCRSNAAKEVDRKFLVTRLMRCQTCQLQFRTPTDTEEFSHRFYNFSYQEGDAMICPSIERLAELKRTNFSGTDRCFAGYIEFLKGQGIGPPSRILDYGCSWGHGSYQFATAGYEVRSYEVGIARRNYGIEHLGVRHVDDLFEVASGHPLFESFDCFFSAHVLEHVPSPSKVIDLAYRCLKPGGVFVAFTPNGCDEFRKFDPRSWSNMWGLVHPNYLDDVFYEKHFRRSRRLYAAQAGGDVMKQYELGFVAWKSESGEGF